MEELEKQARENENLIEADSILNRLNELREKQILLRNFALIEDN